jgi:cytochrome bd ubiquinol oxidase subunit II
VLLLPVPIATLTCYGSRNARSRGCPCASAQGNEYGAWVPFGCTVGLYLLAFYGLAYSLFPYLVVDRIDIWQAASAPESLLIIFVGAVSCCRSSSLHGVRLPDLRGKARALDYG